jgi:hypothetical protein
VVPTAMEFDVMLPGRFAYDSAECTLSILCPVKLQFGCHRVGVV